MAGKSLIRLAKNTLKRGQGSQPQRFLFTMRPTCLGALQKGLHNYDKVVLLWQGGGTKLQYTLVTPVDKATGMVTFEKNCQLRQTTTVYKKGDVYEPKDYMLKLQSVVSTKGGTVDKTTTIGKFKLDFTDFCRLSAAHGEEEIAVSLPGPDSPRCVLHAFVGAVFLKNVDPNDDSQSEMSCMTTPTSLGDDELEGYGGDQDLSGFEERAGKGPASTGVLSPDSNRRRNKGTPATDASLATISEGSGQLTPHGDHDRAAPSNSTFSFVTPPQPTAKPGKAFSSMFKMAGKKESAVKAAPPPLTPEQLRQARSQREKVDIQAEEDIDALRTTTLALLRQRDNYQVQVEELKQLLKDAQSDVQTDYKLTQDLVKAKLALADAEYQKLDLALALQIGKNRIRLLSSKITSLGVERDLADVGGRR